MRKLTVNRPQRIKIPFMKGRILLNGNECATVKAGKNVTIDIPDGNHSVQVTFPAIPPVESDILYITASDGNITCDINIKVPISNNDLTTASLTKI